MIQVHYDPPLVHLLLLAPVALGALSDPAASPDMSS